jgi:hypothetical protein
MIYQWFGLKTIRMISPDLTSKQVVMVSPGLASKPVATGFSVCISKSVITV